MAIETESTMEHTDTNDTGWEAPHYRAGLFDGGRGIAVLVSGLVAALMIGFVAGCLTAPKTAASPAVAVTTSSIAVSGGGSAAKPAGSVPTLDQALALHTAGKLDEAVVAYKAILVADPANKFALYNLGQIAQQRGGVDEATTDYAGALKIDSSYVPALYNLSLIKAAKGDTDGAIALLRTAVAVEPKNANANFNLGKLLITSGKDVEGADFVAKAVALDPSLKP